MPKLHPTRRKFLKTASTAAAGFMIVPRHVLGGKGYTAPSDIVNIAAIGAGGKGRSGLRAVESQNIIGLCDVDDNMAADSRKAYPKAKYYRDYRQMLDEISGDIDAVVISTPDHTHAITGLACMALGKHVYIEKPLAHSIEEVRLLSEAAKANPKLITQMGNQGASGEGIRKTQEIYEAGLLGDVHTVRAFTNRPVWPQGGGAPKGSTPIPDHFDWNLWLGGADMRDHHENYHPFAWRGFWDFGTGALGDMGCHILDTPFYILELGYPTSAEASVSQVFSRNWSADYNPASCPPSSKVHLQFPARGEKPPVELIWSDGGILPRRPDGMTDADVLGDGDGNGFIMEGTRGTLVADVYGANPRIIPSKLMDNINVPETLPRVTTSHGMDWINGIKENYQPSSHFGKAGPLTETVLMGNLAVRGYTYRFPDPNGKDKDAYMVPGRTKLEWDGPKMEVTNVNYMNYFVKNQKKRKF
jgi:predicted dehydrogenase